MTGRRFRPSSRASVHKMLKLTITAGFCLKSTALFPIPLTLPTAGRSLLELCLLSTTSSSPTRCSTPRSRATSAACLGGCCVHGDRGAPLEPDERAELERALPVVAPALRPEALAVIARAGRLGGGASRRPLRHGLSTGASASSSSTKAIRAARRQVRASSRPTRRQPRLREAHLVPPLPDPRGGPTARTATCSTTSRSTCARPPSRTAAASASSSPTSSRGPLTRKYGADWYDAFRAALRRTRRRRPLDRLGPSAASACYPLDPDPSPPRAMLNLQQKQSLQQKLSPQQIQYIKLLQLPTLALEQRIKAELEINPLLEEGEEEEDEITRPRPTRPPEAEGDDDAGDPRATRTTSSTGTSSSTAPTTSTATRPAWTTPPRRTTARCPMPYKSSMAEYLRDQIGHARLRRDAGPHRRADHRLHRRGRLPPPPHRVDPGRHHVQPGPDADRGRRGARAPRASSGSTPSASPRATCASASSSSSTAMPDEVDGRENAIDVLRDCYKAFTMKHFDTIMRKLNIDEEELKEAYDLIQRLDPKPGEGEFAARRTTSRPTSPSSTSTASSSSRSTAGTRPSCAINRALPADVERPLGRRSATASQGDERQRRRDASSSSRRAWRARAGSSTRSSSAAHTMLKVMERHRRDPGGRSSASGEGHLRPMILKDIAENIHMDISTICAWSTASTSRPSGASTS